MQDVLELNSNPGKPRQVQRLQHDLDQPKSHPSMCSPLSVPQTKMQRPSRTVRISHKAGKSLQSAEREAQHMGLAQHCDRNGLPEAQREGKKRHSQALGVCWLRGICHNSHQVVAEDLQVIFQPFFSFSERKRTSSNVFI